MCDLPIIVVSYDETEASPYRDDPVYPVTVLDAVIGEAITGKKRSALFKSNLVGLGEALNSDPSRGTAESHLLEIELMSEEENPIRRRIKQMQMDLPIIFDLEIYPLHDRPGYVGSRRSILGGLKISGSICRKQVLLAYDVYVRAINCSACNTFELANVLSEYGLARKAIQTVGISVEPWQRLLEETPYT